MVDRCPLGQPYSIDLRVEGGEEPEVANAIEQHYYPRSSSDTLPVGELAIVMALSDKLETLVGILGVGYVPSGEKDPFALRRAAIGVVRILLHNRLKRRDLPNDINLSLTLDDLLKIAYSSFEGLNLNPNTVNEAEKFILDRLANYLAGTYPKRCVQSVLNVKHHGLHIYSLPSLLDKLRNFADDVNNQPLLQANKRIKNILKNQPMNVEAKVDESLLTEPAEISLFDLFKKSDSIYSGIAHKIDWDNDFKILAKFNQPITDFFDNVMVMVDDLKVRANRLVLLSKLELFFNRDCDLSELN